MDCETLLPILFAALDNNDVLNKELEDQSTLMIYPLEARSVPLFFWSESGLNARLKELNYNKSQ